MRRLNFQGTSLDTAKAAQGCRPTPLGECLAERDGFVAGYEFMHRKDQLTDDELVRLAGIFSAFGTRKIRLTCGEPLLHRGVPGLVAKLREAGLPRISLSLGALDDVLPASDVAALLEHDGNAIETAGLQNAANG